MTKMNFTVLIVVALLVCIAEANEEKGGNIEARGKGKYALLIHFFYVAATKLFILKIVYGIIFIALITKGWHFVLWFLHYIKQKKEHVEYIEPEPFHHHHDHGYGHHGFEHGYEEPYQGYDQPYHGYGKTPFEEYPSDKKGVYDADGSYSVKNSRLA